jgi:hypothetical protein
MPQSSHDFGSATQTHGCCNGTNATTTVVSSETTAVIELHQLPQVGHQLLISPEDAEGARRAARINGEPRPALPLPQYISALVSESR